MGSGDDKRQAGDAGAGEPAVDAPASEHSAFEGTVLEHTVLERVAPEAIADELAEAEDTVAELVAADEADAELARSDPGAPPKHHSRFLARLGEKRSRHLERGYVYRVGFAVLGFCVFAAGIAMLVLPGPGLLVSAIGLAMLALEFAWAERLLVRVVHRLEQAKDQTRKLLRRRRTQA